MPMFGHSSNLQEDSSLIVDDATDVFFELPTQFGLDHGPTRLRGEDDMVDEVRARTRRWPDPRWMEVPKESGLSLPGVQYMELDMPSRRTRIVTSVDAGLRGRTRRSGRARKHWHPYMGSNPGAYATWLYDAAPCGAPEIFPRRELTSRLRHLALRCRPMRGSGGLATAGGHQGLTPPGFTKSTHAGLRRIPQRVIAIGLSS